MKIFLTLYSKFDLNGCYKKSSVMKNQFIFTALLPSILLNGLLLETVKINIDLIMIIFWFFLSNFNEIINGIFAFYALSAYALS